MIFILGSVPIQMCEAACAAPFQMEFARWLQAKHSVASWASDPLQVIRCKRVVPFSLWKGGASYDISKGQVVFQSPISRMFIGRGGESEARLWELALVRGSCCMSDRPFLAT